MNRLALTYPWMNAAGMLGFAPPSSWHWPEPPGAFVTNPISLRPRSPAEHCRVVEYPGGVLLHSGLPNPGLRLTLRRHAPDWRLSTIPVWAHIIGNTPADIREMALALEDCEGIAALEVGIPPDAASRLAVDLLAAAVGELPVIAHIPLTQANESWLAELPEAGISAITLGAPRGSLPVSTGGMASGRLYGPGIWPQVVHALSRALEIELPVIAGTGIFGLSQGKELLKLGAAAVQIDTALWKPAPVVTSPTGSSPGHH